MSAVANSLLGERCRVTANAFARPRAVPARPAEVGDERSKGSPSQCLGDLRVVLVGPLPPPAGGMAGQTAQLAELLKAAGVQVQLVPTNPPYRPAWVARVRGLRAVTRLPEYVLSLWRACGPGRVMHLMANSGWSWHLFAMPAILVASWRDCPVVVNYRGGEAGTFLERSHRLVSAALRRCSSLIVPSGFLVDVFGRHGIRASVVPNIVDLDRFRPAQDRTPQAHLVVARNLEPIYDNATALRAFARVVQALPNARLTVAGTGPEEAPLRALCESLGIARAVHFAGRLDREAMASLYRDADLSLNPSRVDNMPNSVLESLASGVPVVSTAVGGVPYIVEDGRTALLVPPGDPEAMAAAALRLLRQPDLAQHLSREGLAEVRRYDWPHVAPLLADVYQAALISRVER